MVYFSLFCISFLSATLLPLGSEGLLLYDLAQGYTMLYLWIIATVGNTLGAIVNYQIGKKGENYLLMKGYLNSQRMQKSQILFKKYGVGALLLSWVPIVGDPLTFVAGVLQYPFTRFLLWVTIAKGTRYGVLIFLASNVSV